MATVTENHNWFNCRKRDWGVLILSSQTLPPLKSETSGESGQVNGRSQRARELLQTVFYGNNRNIANMNSKCLPARPSGYHPTMGRGRAYKAWTSGMGPPYMWPTPQVSPSSMYLWTTLAGLRRVEITLSLIFSLSLTHTFSLIVFILQIQEPEFQYQNPH